jgi:DNA polymerase elongation subunit (family B)
MSLNISPETKVAKVLNFDMEQHFRKEIVAYVIQEMGNDTTVELEYDAFVQFIQENNLTMASNGVLYSTISKGIIPEVLEEWFAKRVEYKNLMKKYTNEGDKVQAAYYDQRQHIQKIFLNSLYGVLGLPVFRFYDVDNAAAVTLTGQDVIKTTAKFINLKYENATGEKKDHCVYVDTDSVYFPAKPLFTEDAPDALAATIDIAYDMESGLNKFYDSMAKRMFNCDSHKFHIKGESVAKTGFWVAKKRYALDKVYDLETHQTVSKLVVKGLDVVRSSFPKAFREFMTQMLKDILGRVDKNELDDKILALKTSLKTRHYLEVARNTSANNISQFAAGEGGGGINRFKKGTPAHIKAAIVYNRLLTHFNIQTRYEPIADGAKIKYVYLKDNPLHIDALAIKGYQDPPQIVEMITEYIDTDALFENELRNKLHDFYSALSWGLIPTEKNQNSNEFFTF